MTFTPRLASTMGWSEMDDTAPGGRRVALVMAGHTAAVAAPPGVDRVSFGFACLADTYEVLADLMGVRAGIIGPVEVDELLWPGDLRMAHPTTIRDVARELSATFDEMVIVPGDAPDLPGLVLAKVFKVLHRVDLAISPQRGRPFGAVAIGIRLPMADWIDDTLIDLDRVDPDAAAAAAPARNRMAITPDWHRLRTPADFDRLDPRLEGWEETRALLERPLLRRYRTEGA